MNEKEIPTAGEQTQLSKWWRTPSAQAAIRRAEENKREKIAAMKRRIEERKAALHKEIWGEEAG